MSGCMGFVICKGLTFRGLGFSVEGLGLRSSRASVLRFRVEKFRGLEIWGFRD